MGCSGKRLKNRLKMVHKLLIKIETILKKESHVVSWRKLFWIHNKNFKSIEQKLFKISVRPICNVFRETRFKYRKNVDKFVLHLICNTCTTQLAFYIIVLFRPSLLTCFSSVEQESIHLASAFWVDLKAHIRILMSTLFNYCIIDANPSLKIPMEIFTSTSNITL